MAKHLLVLVLTMSFELRLTALRSTGARKRRREAMVDGGKEEGWLGTESD
jgi:hypothetical protein